MSFFRGAVALVYVVTLLARPNTFAAARNYSAINPVRPLYGDRVLVNGSSVLSSHVVRSAPARQLTSSRLLEIAGQAWRSRRLNQTRLLRHSLTPMVTRWKVVTRG